MKVKMHHDYSLDRVFAYFLWDEIYGMRYVIA